MASLMVLPVFPLNPLEQDTVHTANIHLTGGFRGPNGVVSWGPEMTAGYELMIHHPVIVRGLAGYKFGRVTSALYPNGDVHAATLAADGLYYRGTDELTGYVGFGLLYVFHYFYLTRSAADSLGANHSIDKVRLLPAPGYRFTLGLRYHQRYSVEVSITEVRAEFSYRRRYGRAVISEMTEGVRLNDFRVTFGYLMPIGHRR